MAMQRLITEILQRDVDTIGATIPELGVQEGLSATPAL
ncbi:hypothetical protein SAMN05216525_11187 [Bradyrhizobium sp. Gha]|nr:hypothetical protein SAMN05216525_11187 [Bradyrhizobium sp. Gha]